ncbi:DUF397 domain-containing protein [Streptomyces sp. HU2014]|uniref:DUF397 domain-containing protein n=1 Tax=Streptomyces sp. HU2014 TaxID=2939414 RepID=UPI00200E90BF|nr:DUF397 domain-containing protein [Streptomyces sp. HU2014]UQI43770.1 DUF397 domain-containing protein [Streptomyces sp. HU2014]
MSRDITWQKSSFSGGGGEQCVELATHADDVLIRESDTPTHIIRTTAATARAFLTRVRRLP